MNKKYLIWLRKLINQSDSLFSELFSLCNNRNMIFNQTVLNHNTVSFISFFYSLKNSFIIYRDSEIFNSVILYFVYIILGCPNFRKYLVIGC